MTVWIENILGSINQDNKQMPQEVANKQYRAAHGHIKEVFPPFKPQVEITYKNANDLDKAFREAIFMNHPEERVTKNGMAWIEEVDHPASIQDGTRIESPDHVHPKKEVARLYRTDTFLM